MMAVGVAPKIRGVGGGGGGVFEIGGVMVGKYNKVSFF